jgi:hypothetical protein
MYIYKYIYIYVYVFTYIDQCYLYAQTDHGTIYHPGLDCMRACMLCSLALMYMLDEKFRLACARKCRARVAKSTIRDAAQAQDPTLQTLG